MKKYTGMLMYVLVFASLQGCKKITSYLNPPTTLPSYTQVNLVANLSTLGAAKTDPTLINAWGIAIGPSGVLWVNANNGGVSEVYDKDGNTLLAPVIIPSNTGTTGGTPSGIVYNNTQDFKVPQTQALSKFIFVNEDGSLSAWVPGMTSAIKVADRSDSNAVYKGLALDSIGSVHYLYATNFHTGTIDVFDKNFSYVSSIKLQDATIPAGFAPFNIQNIGGNLFVTYAKQKLPDKHDDQSGAGFGYVDIFKPDGTFLKRFASAGTLNSPWGIAQAPLAFGQGVNAILIGNFGDGRINVFDAAGNYKGQLQSNGSTLSIDGLWAISFPPDNLATINAAKLFFTAGPNGESNGLVGSITIK